MTQKNLKPIDLGLSEKTGFNRKTKTKKHN